MTSTRHGNQFNFQMGLGLFWSKILSAFLIFIGWARKLKKSSLGLTVGWLQDVIKEDKKNTFLANIGFLYPVSECFTLGVVAQNIGSKLGSDPLPLTFKVGAASKLKALTFALDVAKPQDNEIYYCLGTKILLVR